jgi:hypothetical protein
MLLEACREPSLNKRGGISESCFPERVDPGKDATLCFFNSLWPPAQGEFVHFQHLVRSVGAAHGLCPNLGLPPGDLASSDFSLGVPDCPFLPDPGFC